MSVKIPKDYTCYKSLLTYFKHLLHFMSMVLKRKHSSGFLNFCKFKL